MYATVCWRLMASGCCLGPTPCHSMHHGYCLFPKLGWFWPHSGIPGPMAVKQTTFKLSGLTQPFIIAHRFRGSRIWTEHGGNDLSLLHNVRSLHWKAQKRGAGIIWKPMRSPIRWLTLLAEMSAAPGLSTGPGLPHSVVTEFPGQVSREGQVETMFFF